MSGLYGLATHNDIAVFAHCSADHGSTFASDHLACGTCRSRYRGPSKYDHEKRQPPPLATFWTRSLSDGEDAVSGERMEDRSH